MRTLHETNAEYKRARVHHRSTRQPTAERESMYTHHQLHRVFFCFFFSRCKGGGQWRRTILENRSNPWLRQPHCAPTVYSYSYSTYSSFLACLYIYIYNVLISHVRLMVRRLRFSCRRSCWPIYLRQCRPPLRLLGLPRRRCLGSSSWRKTLPVCRPGNC